MAQVVTHATHYGCARCDPYMPKRTTVRFICEFRSERAGTTRTGRRGAGTRHSCANATLVPTEDALRKVVLKRKEAAIENCRNLRMF